MRVCIYSYNYIYTSIRIEKIEHGIKYSLHINAYALIYKYIPFGLAFASHPSTPGTRSGDRVASKSYSE